MNECFEKYIRSDNITFKYALGLPLFSGREFHLHHEIVLFLNGKCDFVSENLKCQLAPNTLVIIPKEKYHHFNFTDNPNDYYRCTLNFYETEKLKELLDDTMTNVKVISHIPTQIMSHFKKLIEKEKSNIPSYQKEIILSSILNELLIDIANINADYFEDIPNLTPLTKDVIDYINNNFQKCITIEDISKQFNVSISSLSHIFKNDLHISVYRYILNKRLITARRMIINGTPVMHAATQCGFNDYSGFFKAYKKYFNFSPAETHQKYC